MHMQILIDKVCKVLAQKKKVTKISTTHNITIKKNIYIYIFNYKEKIIIITYIMQSAQYYKNEKL